MDVGSRFSPILRRSKSTPAKNVAASAVNATPATSPFARGGTLRRTLRDGSGGGGMNKDFQPGANFNNNANSSSLDPAEVAPFVTTIPVDYAPDKRSEKRHQVCRTSFYYAAST